MRPKPLVKRHPSEIVGLDELAAHWGKPPASIISDRVRAPWRVPPACSPAGVRPLRFRVGTILSFDAETEEKAYRARREARVRASATTQKKKRGRPSAAEKRARRGAEAQS